MTTTPARAATTAGHYVAHIDGPDGTVPIDVERIERTIADAKRPVVEGTPVEPEENVQTMVELVGHVGLLLGPAEARYRALCPNGAPYQGLTTSDFDALQRRLDYDRPDPRNYPLQAMIWLSDLGRSCQTLLDLATSGQTADQRDDEVAE
ncbi:DUF6415 family natural product biosynthesis protein [Streptomyces mobaraensis]|uniref:Uncharacterized protein n=1 Tax=Streptomyces mobaraensis TaxID=35621 RepID=A0A5N5VXE4_STRMB|nr:DUF6415 family natural product biosynthesis protein [Streptomyces mobaraensis]KAB7833526.1 hypothetical protein FRZ00_33295 [Streptomyces mobaraensis]